MGGEKAGLLRRVTNIAKNFLGIFASEALHSRGSQLVCAHSASSTRRSRHAERRNHGIHRQPRPPVHRRRLLKRRPAFAALRVARVPRAARPHGEWPAQQRRARGARDAVPRRRRAAAGALGAARRRAGDARARRRRRRRRAAAAAARGRGWPPDEAGAGTTAGSSAAFTAYFRAQQLCASDEAWAAVEAAFGRPLRCACASRTRRRRAASPWRRSARRGDRLERVEWALARGGCGRPRPPTTATATPRLSSCSR